MPAACWSRLLTTTAASQRSARRSRAAKPGRTRGSSRSLGVRNAVSTNAGDICARTDASRPVLSRSPSPASSQHSSGRLPPSMSERSTPTIAPGTLPGRARAPRKAHDRRSRPATLLRATGSGRPRPLLDSEPRRIPGLEVPKPSNISLTPQSTRLDLPLVPPRQRPGNANTIQRRRPPTHGVTVQPPYQ